METSDKLIIYNSRKKDPAITWVLFLLLGWSYGSFGKIGLQLVYYFTLAGLGIWWIARLFSLNKDIKKYNKQIALEVGLTADEMLNLGL